jgi:colanic acid/amylovoran biosynthesis protein
MKNKILILHFPSLNNYGTGMMGINTIHHLQKCSNGNIDFFCDFAPYFDVTELDHELEDSAHVHSCAKIQPTKIDNFILFKKLRPLRNALFHYRQLKSYKAVIILGGDDFSEYYRPNIWMSFCKIFVWSLRTPVILLGQTMGPFHKKLNRIACRFLMRKCHIFARDNWTVEYLRNEFFMKNVHAGTDLAFLDLPRQHDAQLWDEITNQYGLITNQYVTVVISALGGLYYTKDINDYMNTWEKTILALLNHQSLRDKKICMLAHTFYPFGDESSLIKEIYSRIPQELRTRVVLITNPILPTKARLVLGNGLLTITGRMHAAVSTFQMGKPAISLAYSKKYEGVIGANLGMQDLIIDANNPCDWANDSITNKIMEKTDKILCNYENINRQININIEKQKTHMENTLRTITERIT